MAGDRRICSPGLSLIKCEGYHALLPIESKLKIITERSNVGGKVPGQHMWVSNTVKMRLAYLF